MGEIDCELQMTRNGGAVSDEFAKLLEKKTFLKHGLLSELNGCKFLIGFIFFDLCCFNDIFWAIGV